MTEQNKAVPTEAQMRAIRAAEALSVVYNSIIDFSKSARIERQAENIVAQAQSMQIFVRNIMALYSGPHHIQSDIQLLLADFDVKSKILEVDPNDSKIVN